MPEIKDNTYNDLSPVSSGVTLTTCSEDASKSGEKAHFFLRVSLQRLPDSKHVQVPAHHTTVR